MDLIKFEDKHYEDIKPWFAQYGWTAPALDVLPRTGFVALSEGKPVCAGFYYKSCSGMAYMDWMIGDQNASPLSRGKGVVSIVNAIKEDAKANGFKILYTVTANQPLISTYKKLGLQEMETGATTLALSLDGSTQDFLR